MSFSKANDFKAQSNNKSVSNNQGQEKKSTVSTNRFKAIETVSY